MIKRFIPTIFLSIYISLINIHEIFSLEPSDIINKVYLFLKRNNSFKGNFEFYENKKIFIGQFFFRKPNYLKMIFTDNGKKSGNQLISDGKNLWLYLPAVKILINQDLIINKEKNYFNELLNIQSIFNCYEYNLQKNYSKPEKIQGFSFPLYQIILYKKKREYGFKKLILYIREDGFISKVKAIGYNNKVWILVRKNLTLNIKITKDKFKKRIPEDFQYIKNPFS